MLIFGIYLVILMDNTHEFMSAVYMWVLTEAKKNCSGAKGCREPRPNLLQYQCMLLTYYTSVLMQPGIGK